MRDATWRERRSASSLACAICCLLAGATAAFPQGAPPRRPRQARRQRRLRRRHRSLFDDALLRAANDLFSKANLPAGNEKIELVVDPLIDGISGAQSTATRLMQDRIVALVR